MGPVVTCGTGKGPLYLKGQLELGGWLVFIQNTIYTTPHIFRAETFYANIQAKNKGQILSHPSYLLQAWIKYNVRSPLVKKIDDTAPFCIGEGLPL